MSSRSFYITIGQSYFHSRMLKLLLCIGKPSRLLHIQFQDSWCAITLEHWGQKFKSWRSKNKILALICSVWLGKEQMRQEIIAHYSLVWIERLYEIFGTSGSILTWAMAFWKLLRHVFLNSLHFHPKHVSNFLDSHIPKCYLDMDQSPKLTNNYYGKAPHYQETSLWETNFIHCSLFRRPKGDSADNITHPKHTTKLN